MQHINLVSVGLLFIFLGFLLVFIGSLTAAPKGEAKIAVVGLIGPIPFGFGNDRKLFLVALGFITKDLNN